MYSTPIGLAFHKWKNNLRVFLIKKSISFSQIEDMQTQFVYPESMLGRCPSCLYNFKKNFCDLTCRADQSRFLNRTRVAELNDGTRESSKRECVPYKTPKKF